MPTRLAALALAVAILSPAVPAAAQSPAKDYMFRRPDNASCRPPLKFAAGACVRRCPAGYEDMGRRCRYRSTSSGNR